MGLLMAQQTHNQCMHALVTITAAASSLLLVVSAASLAWPVQLLAFTLLAAVAALSMPKLMRAAPDSPAAGILGRTGTGSSSAALADACNPLMVQPSKGAQNRVSATVSRFCSRA